MHTLPVVNASEGTEDRRSGNPGRTPEGSLAVRKKDFAVKEKHIPGIRSHKNRPPVHLSNSARTIIQRRLTYKQLTASFVSVPQVE